MNTIALMGTLQSEPELRFTQEGLARLSALMSFPAGRADEPDFQIRVVAFGNLAEEMHRQFHHGDSVLIEGRLQAETRNKPDGTKEKTTEIIARRVHAATGGASIGGAPTTASASNGTAPARPARPVSAPAPARAARPEPEPDDDIPF